MVDGDDRRIWIVSLILLLTHTITYTIISQTTFLFCILGTDGQLWLDTAPIRQRVRAGDTTVLGCTVENLGNSVVSKQSLLAPFLEHISIKTTSEIFQPVVSTLHWRLDLIWDGLWDCIYNLFSSPELKAQVSFSDHLSSVVCLSVCLSICKLFTFSSSSPELLGQFQPNLEQSILG